MKAYTSQELPDYRNDPVAYEVEELSRPDEMAMLDEAGQLGVQILNNRSAAWVLDLCCGTGLSMRKLINHPSVSTVIGVDICLPYLKFARGRFVNHSAELHLIRADAVLLPLKRRAWDLVMLASAYHHIEDIRKVEFLQSIRQLIGMSGSAVMAENILPPYEEDSSNQYRMAVRNFYTQVLRSARLENPDLSEYVAGLIERVAQYGFDGDYEYKVSMKVLLRHLEQANLKIIEEIRVWPKDTSLDRRSGNFVFLLQGI